MNEDTIQHIFRVRNHRVLKPIQSRLEFLMLPAANPLRLAKRPCISPYVLQWNQDDVNAQPRRPIDEDILLREMMRTPCHRLQSSVYMCVNFPWDHCAREYIGNAFDLHAPVFTRTF